MMASLSFTCFPSLPRWQFNSPVPCSLGLAQIQAIRLHSKWGIAAVSKNKVEEPLAQTLSSGEANAVKKSTKSKRAPARSKEEASAQIEENEPGFSKDTGVTLEKSVAKSGPSDEFLKARRGPRKKASSSPGRVVEEKSETGRKGRKTKKQVAHEATQEELTARDNVALTTNIEDESKDNLDIRTKEKMETGRKQRKTDKKTDDQEYSGPNAEVSDRQSFVLTADTEDKNKEEDELLVLDNYEDEDISATYGWPPLVCCFGAAQHAFVPSGRPANRLIDYEIHERLKDAIWAPKKFVRAPGGSADSVAVALARLGGKVALMGKLGADDFGQTMLYYLNLHHVQTRSVRIDNEKATAISKMKISKRGSLRLTCVRTCAEDSLAKSEINIDVLKEAKMFYFNTSSLIDQNMRATLLRAVKISKRFGGVTFYDLNLPMPLWQFPQETKDLIQEAWNFADLIEVTKQELEFLCGIEAFENFESKDNDQFKFIHYAPELVEPLWHENLKVLFVTNGTSKIHYYTKEHNNAILGMEDPPLTPFTSDMSASGDAIVAALMRMLTVQPHLMTDKAYLEHAIKYAINCGVIDQWLLARKRGFPPREGMEEDVVPDLDGIRSITEKEFRTLGRI